MPDINIDQVTAQDDAFFRRYMSRPEQVKAYFGFLERHPEVFLATVPLGPDGRRGDWIQTSTGRKFWPFDPRPEDIDFEDVAWSLSNRIRFNGHCRPQYSVAQHCVLMRQVVREMYGENWALEAWAMLHDADEAYLPDIPTPVKVHFPGWKKIVAQLVMNAVCTRFAIPVEEPKAIKMIDKRIVADEAKVVLRNPQIEMGRMQAPLGIEIEPMPQVEAYRAYLDNLCELFPWVAAEVSRRGSNDRAETHSCAEENEP